MPFTDTLKKISLKLYDLFGKSADKECVIKLHWFVDEPNFGDLLNVDLFQNLSDKKLVRADRKHCDVVAIGSLLQIFLSKKAKSSKPVIVYGSGFIKAPIKEDVLMRPLDVRALRGFKTLERLKKCPNVHFADHVAMGDPGLLVSKLFDVSTVQKKYKLGIIPHYVDQKNPLLDKIKVKNSIILDVKQQPSVLIHQIAECEYIISSAMHGLIAADSLGIPNIRMVMSDKIAGGDYKFDDYYSAFGIDQHNVVDLNKQDFTDEDLSFVKSQYKISSQQVADLQNGLLEAFPYKKEI